MTPALSVIFFTVVSGCGFGLLFCAGVLLALDPAALSRAMALTALAAGAALAIAGLVASTLHLGRPRRAWRAFSQWRSSWLSREGVAAVATFVPLLAAFACAYLGAPAAALRGAGAALALLAAATVCCTARIYTSLPTIAAWRDALVLPGYALFALLGGAAVLWLLDAVFGGNALGALLPMLVATAAAACATVKREYWHAIDSAACASTPESATGLGRFGHVRAAEAPHTEENYLTREFGFALARRHAAKLRAIAVVLLALLPVAMAAAAMFLPLPAAPLAVLAAAGVVAGTFVERWLFFAEAKHVVMLYYERGASAEGGAALALRARDLQH